MCYFKCRADTPVRQTRTQETGEINTPALVSRGQECPRHIISEAKKALQLIRSFLINLCLVALLSAPLAARRKVPAPVVDTDYIVALSAANHFLHAWQTSDQETGILMLTNRLKQKTSEDALSNFFSSASDRPQSFEIERGRRLAPGRYKFPVTLFHAPASFNQRRSPRTSGLIVVHAGKDDWAIDRLP
jgi:hypothetical protein